MSKAEDTKETGETPRQLPTTSNPIVIYLHLVWSSVFAPFIVDVLSTGIVVLLLWGIAQCLVRIIQTAIAVTPLHVSQAAALLGICYLVAIAIMTARRFYHATFHIITFSTVVPDSQSNIKKEK